MGIQMVNSNQFVNEVIDFLIIGGGVAGLAVANRLVDLKKNPVLIEAKNYPSHKVCGEFLSPEVLPYLENWGITPECLIKEVHIFSNKDFLQFEFPSNAACISRYQMDFALANRIKKKGGYVLTNISVNEFKIKRNSSLYEVKLSDGKILTARNIFIGAGRIFKATTDNQKPLPYFGFKAHFKGIDLEERLEMHLLPRAYLGISQIEKNVINIACLAKIDPKMMNQPQKFIENLLNTPAAYRIKEKMNHTQMIFDEWLFTPAPHYKAKQNPPLKNVYYIGDAAGTLPPATGAGLSLALYSGYMAAEYAIREETEAYQFFWNKCYEGKILIGNILHHVMLNPVLAKTSFYCCHFFPSLKKKIFFSMRSF